MTVPAETAFLFSFLIAIVVVAYTLFIRTKDLPPPPPEDPFRFLDERKARIYEGLRDLQFEFRVGKLSDADYQNAKQNLQKELAALLAEVEELKAKLAAEGKQVKQTAPKPKGKPA